MFDESVRVSSENPLNCGEDKELDDQQIINAERVVESQMLEIKMTKAKSRNILGKAGK